MYELRLGSARRSRVKTVFITVFTLRDTKTSLYEIIHLRWAFGLGRDMI
jgi:hypothetical protein